MMTILSCITEDHNPWVIALAALICVAGSWTTVRLFKRAAAARWPESGAWFILTALITGASIWCTHFIAVLGYRPGTLVAFDPVLTIVSLLVAMMGAGMGFIVATFGGRPASLFGGSIVGLSIVVMHYTGMMGYRVEGIVSWDMPYLVASILISCILSAASLVVIRASDGVAGTYGGTALLVLAIVGLHFTGMTAFRVEPLAIDDAFSNPAALRALAMAVAGVALVIIVAGFASGMIDDRSRTNAAEALSNMSNGLVAVSATGRITLFNRRVNEMFGLAEDDIQMNMSLGDFLSNIGRKSGWSHARIERVIANHVVWLAKAETTMVEHDFDTGRVIAVVCRPLPKGGAILTYEDVTEARTGQRRITHMAYHDALTGLSNRRMFNDTIEAVASTDDYSLLMIDLDRFKTVNDKYGHAAGDDLLVQVSLRLRAALSQNDRAFRLGGDEFAVLLPLDTHGAEDVARRIVEALAAPFAVGTNLLRIGGSVGIAAISAGDDASTVQQRADLALYKAKKEGRGRVALYKDGMFEEAAERLAFAEDLAMVVERGQLELHYQPLLALPDRRLAGFEALLRWRHPDKGMISPAEFVPIAEASGAIEKIGAWVMREALREAARWPEDVYVSVNVSPVQLRSPAILSQIRRALADFGLSPERVEIEITETAMVDNSGQISAMLAGLRALGVRLAIDDFGTGYSSLAHLREFKVDRIKIDRSFISGVGEGPDEDRGASAVVRAVIGMARDMSIDTTAEGIETSGQLERVVGFGCSTGQGYLLGRPMTAAAAGSLVKSSGGVFPLMRAS
ncbi:EAL domain-containing protein [Fulvimarina sp. 2208YS6-2-32]|uniref:EAL domain-containing protein n=1 Tax=Fulvimarina uroteuthidis TaxID=3098149 RepID=A0ABU5I0I4_9HYPH|nr:EAL domain-containing protein [Fulvimarina sp. 2208YS6-2-32]MDY8108899.1 EAL domain-containing protein [Fulvimarina sp. 2208YS6-2-32]